MTTVKKAKPVNTEKDKKPKLVRDSFTMPKNEYAAIDALKQRALQMAVAPKKSELLRAGLMALTSMDDTTFKKALAAVPTLKTGRPSSQDANAATIAPAPTPAKAPAKAPAKKAPVAKKAAAHATTASKPAPRKAMPQTAVKTSAAKQPPR